jgi:hypothetical protein
MPYLISSINIEQIEKKLYFYNYLIERAASEIDIVMFRLHHNKKIVDFSDSEVKLEKLKGCHSLNAIRNIFLN